MFKVRNLVKTYGEKETGITALKGINLDIETGEVLSIMGPSGCGKSTLLNILSGIDRADSGEIWLDETPLHQLDDDGYSQMRLNHMGFIFQQYHLIPVLNALENVTLPLLSKRMSESAAKREALDALERVGLGDKVFNKPSALSGGQAQRVAIARAIAGNPKIIWADEPTGALDSETSRQIIELITSLNIMNQTTVVIVTHDSTIAEATGRTIFMKNGEIINQTSRK